MKILIVEDEEILSKVIKEEFQVGGYEIKIAKDGEEALNLSKSFHPNIILLDILLPKKSGLDVLTELKANSDLKNIPVIMLSNLSSDESIKKALTLGAVDYFVKTQHSIYEVVEKIQKYIAK
jgi:DNA-binding response OmpR family regulator